MGNEVSRQDQSPQTSGVVPPRSPYTPTGSSLHHDNFFNLRSESPGDRASFSQRRTSSSASLESSSSLNPQKERSIQRMDKAIRRRVRGGITYNMKLLIRGAKGSGKTSLFQRLKGEPIPETHQSTPQLQSATINWSYRQNSEDNIKCEVWDVVDRGFKQLETEDETKEDSRLHEFSDAKRAEESSKRLSVEGTAAARMHNGTHAVAIVDASTVDVYHEAHGVIFLLDITKWDTLEYVKQQLDNVPVHIPTLVLGNFRDKGAERKIFKEDIQKLLYGSTDRPQQQQWKRPTELLYFECSLLNCYGLKSLHQYFGIPFLQLKLATIRQQMRIVDSDFVHLKQDIQATISEQRYAEYVEHIKATGSDIRTGRRGCETPPAVSNSNLVESSSTDIGHATPLKQQEGAHDDVSVVEREDRGMTSLEPETNMALKVVKTNDVLWQEQKTTQSQDIEDLPARSSSVVIQGAPQLKFEHKESELTHLNDVLETESKLEDEPGMNEEKSGEPRYDSLSPHHSRMASMEGEILLEDFQVPKPRMNDLDHFLMENESDKEGDEVDGDVILACGPKLINISVRKANHKQRFLDSDSSDSEGSKLAADQHVRKKLTLRKTLSDRTATKNSRMPEEVAVIPESSTSIYSHSSVSRLSQMTSPVLQQPSYVVEETKMESCEVSPEQRQALNPINGRDVAVSSTPSVLPSTLDASLRHEHKDFVVKKQLFQGDGDAAQVSLLSDASLSSDAKGTFVSEVKAESAVQESPDVLLTGKITSLVGNTQLERSSVSTTENFGLAISSDWNDVRNNDSCQDLARDHVKCSLENKSDELTNDIEDFEAAASSNDSQDGGGNDGGGCNLISDMIEEVVMTPSCDDYNGGARDNNNPSDILLSSLQASLPMPGALASPLNPTPASLGISLNMTQCHECLLGHYHKKNHIEADKNGSLSSLKPLSTLLEETTISALPIHDAYPDGGDSDSATTLHLPDFTKNSSKSIDSDYAIGVSSNDLETFLNEGDIDAENAPPHIEPSLDCEYLIRQKDQSISSAMAESSEDDKEDLERFSRYSTSKKSRNERRRQRKEDLRRLNDALDPYASSTSEIAVSGSSFETSDVMEAIRQAQEEALRMFQTDSVPADDVASSSLKKKHKHKQKERKPKKRGGEKEKNSNRRSKSSTLSYAR
ncbi:gtp-binding protein parf [Plasmopara halstedii]|uniref:Gtp-binding protein parf n=1 Tax=Plasmopara halstedii TaxID=4781 RepID=A0A0P1AR12_PLAHL|nr:gtp-binding protein parf [Plasmopara halstedii]CEG44001.1 gtp-binding protein parf [Plasmopara halstedii]|eukprot:XP_024580370.1 gtp-binding protein parf [Plasmopara halstedii]